jgi:transposase
MAAVMIGIDPHKATHTAVAISAAEEPLGELQVRACAAQAERLLAWAAAWPERTWAIEGAGGLGHLLAQQLLAAGERVAMCRPSWARGCGCWLPGTPTRTTPTMGQAR